MNDLSKIRAEWRAKCTPKRVPRKIIPHLEFRKRIEVKLMVDDAARRASAKNRLDSIVWRDYCDHGHECGCGEFSVSLKNNGMCDTCGGAITFDPDDEGYGS